MVSKGVVQEQSLKAARYTLNDLMEQLRAGGNFELSTVEYAILETNGQLSVLLKGPSQPVTYEALSLESPKAQPPFLLVQDGKIHKEALRQSGYDEKWLNSRLKSAGIKGPERLLFAFLSGNTLHVQSKGKDGGRVAFIDAGGKNDS